MAAPRGRPRKNPLIPVEPERPAETVAPEPIGAPICTQHWPDGWAALPEGADFASCEHGDWSTNGYAVTHAATDLNAMTRLLAPLADDGTGPYVIDGVTTDGTPVKVTIRPGEPALISLSDVQLGSVAISPLASTVAASGLMPGGRLPSGVVAPVSPFKPQPAPAPVEIDPGELDAGEDVMFMPSGG